MGSKRSRTDDDNNNDEGTPMDSSSKNRRVVSAIRPPPPDHGVDTSKFQGRQLLVQRTDDHDDAIRELSHKVFASHGNATDLTETVQQLIRLNEPYLKEQNPYYPLDAPITSSVSKEDLKKFRERCRFGSSKTKDSQTTKTTAPAFGSTSITVAAPMFSFGNSSSGFKTAAPPAPSTSGFTFKPASSTNAAPVSSTNDPIDDDAPQDATLEVQTKVEDGWTVVSTFAKVAAKKSMPDKSWKNVMHGPLDIQTEPKTGKTRLLMKNMHGTYLNLVVNVKPVFKESKKKLDGIFIAGYNAVEDDDTKGEGKFMIMINKQQSKELLAMIEKAV